MFRKISNLFWGFKIFKISRTPLSFDYTFNENSCINYWFLIKWGINCYQLSFIICIIVKIVIYADPKGALKIRIL